MDNAEFELLVGLFAQHCVWQRTELLTVFEETFGKKGAAAKLRRSLKKFSNASELGGFLVEFKVNSAEYVLSVAPKTVEDHDSFARSTVFNLIQSLLALIK